MKGRKPKTLGQADADGDTRKIGAKKLRQRIASEPKPIRGFPDAPAHLGVVARQIYSEWAEQLASMNQDFRCDAAMIECAAMAYEQMTVAYKVLVEKGQSVEVYKDVEGELFCTGIKVRPEVGIFAKCEGLVKAFAAEMGLSLVSRTRLTIEKQDDHTAEMMALLSTPRFRPMGPLRRHGRP